MWHKIFAFCLCSKCFTYTTIIESILYEYVTVLERRQLKKILEELSFQYSDLSDIEKAKKVGKMLGADFVVIGEIQETYCNSDADILNYLNIRIVDIESGRVCSVLMFKGVTGFRNRTLVK